MLRSTLGAFLPPLRPAHAASDSDSASAFSCLRLKDFREEVEEETKDTLEIRSSHTRVPNRNNKRVEQSNCSSSVVETTNTSAVTTSSTSSGFPPSSSLLSAPRSMWQEAIRRKRYLLDRAGESGEGDKGGGRGQERRNRSPDWLYESYYCMSQQHPLIVFLLLIVMGACLALLAVFFASGLVSCSFTTHTNTDALCKFKNKINIRDHMTKWTALYSSFICCIYPCNSTVNCTDSMKEIHIKCKLCKQCGQVHLGTWVHTHTHTLQICTYSVSTHMIRWLQTTHELPSFS